MWLCGDFPRHLASEGADDLAPTKYLGVGKVAQELEPRIPPPHRPSFSPAALRPKEGYGRVGVFLCAFWAQSGPHKSGLKLFPGDHLSGWGSNRSLQESKQAIKQAAPVLLAALYWPGPADLGK